MTGEWAGRRVLVTGASGFLGSNLALALLRSGAVVYGTARRSSTSDLAINWLQAELTDAAGVRSAFGVARPEIVFHLAGQTNAGHERGLILPTLRNNVDSTVLILLEALERGVPRVVATGSLEEPNDGTDSIALSPYGISKWASVAYARMFSSTFGLPVSIVRAYMTYGPRQSPTKLIPYVAMSLLLGGTPTVQQPDRTVDWIYVDDVVSGLLAAGLAPEATGRVIDLGTGRLTAIRDLVEVIEDVVGRRGATTFPVAGQAVGVAGRKADLNLASQCLNWAPQTPLRAGIEKTVAWYRERTARH